MASDTRLIEVAFPLKQASIDSVHEKNVRQGNISTLHIWPARRPLAACRAALIATLLPDPGDAEKRKELLEKLGGKVKRVVKRKKGANDKTEETVVEETEGGILHWGRETTNRETLEWFREEIRKAYGGRAPRVLDPFAGGGAIPLEAMRLGCETTAIDINPVAWFILKCTLEYPQMLSGQQHRLPDFVLCDEGFMRSFFEAQGYKSAELRNQLEKLGLGANAAPMMKELAGEEVDLDANLAWHVRAWGHWVLNRARRDLAEFYPTYADFEPLQKIDAQCERREMQLVSLRDDGTLDVDSLNAEFDAPYLQNKQNPRWVAKPTVAYLWARTVKCKNCRAIIPLLKTRWLCKKDKKRVVLTMEPNSEKTGVVFGVQTGVPIVGGNGVKRREYDKQVSAGTMSRSGARCPCCRTAIMTMEDIRVEGQAGRLDSIMTAVVVEGLEGKEYRLPTEIERVRAVQAESALPETFDAIPFGLPEEPLPKKETLGFRVPLYGFDKWHKLFTSRQLLALGAFVKQTRNVRDAMREADYPIEFREAVNAFLAIALDRTANYMSTICFWAIGAEEIKQTFLRFALPMTWDFAEANPFSSTDRFYNGAISNIRRVLEAVLPFFTDVPPPKVYNQSAISKFDGEYDVIVTDPPYYDAIPYSDLMDFFYIWLRRALYDESSRDISAFIEPLAPKWNHDLADGELIDDSSRFNGDKTRSKAAYEDGMSRAFQSCQNALSPDGRLVIVFAHKQPDAWETLVSAIIRAGFVVDASYPIVTEMRGGIRNLNRASLASSVWLVCKKRPETARVGWDNRVLEEMRERIPLRLRDFWDAGLRGPDFIWAATGPALEAYSKHPVVKKANDPGKMMTVSEFLRHVRRIVVDFVVGRVLTHGLDAEEATAGLDDVTTYYLLHRHDFKLADAPIGACILYAVSCNLSDAALADQHDILVRTGGSAPAIDTGDEGETEEDAEVETDADLQAQEGTRSRVKLKDWKQRKRAQMGYEAPGGRPVPLIDQVHRLMHFWRAGDVAKVNDYLDSRGLRQNNLFPQLLQALIELAPHASEERSLLENISNHVVGRGTRPEKKQMELTAL